MAGKVNYTGRYHNIILSQYVYVCYISSSEHVTDQRARRTAAHLVKVVSVRTEIRKQSL